MCFHPFADYIWRRGSFLSYLLQASALILLVWASARPACYPELRQYAAYFQFSSLVTLASALLGSILLEDMLRKNST